MATTLTTTLITLIIIMLSHGMSMIKTWATVARLASLQPLNSREEVDLVFKILMIEYNLLSIFHDE